MRAGMISESWRRKTRPLNARSEYPLNDENANFFLLQDLLLDS